MRKNLFVLLTGLFFVLSLTSLAFAQAKPEQPMKTEEAAKPAESAKPEVRKEAPPKPVSYFLGGIVLDVDAKTRKITIEQHQVERTRKLILNVSKKVAPQLAGIRVGEAINAWVTGNTVTKFEMIY